MTPTLTFTHHPTCRLSRPLINHHGTIQLSLQTGSKKVKKSASVSAACHKATGAREEVRPELV